MKKFLLGAFMAMLLVQPAMANDNNDCLVRKIEVNGASTVSIVPDRITVEIGLQEYYDKKSATDSVKVTLAQIEKEARKAFGLAGIADSLIRVSGVGNYYYATDQSEFMMAKQLQATLTDMWQLEELTDKMTFGGIQWFRIAQLDNSEMEKYNRIGLKGALDKAREKAAFIALNEGGRLGQPVSITEDGPLYYEEAMTANVALDGGAMRMKSVRAEGLESMKKIVRRYNVRVIYEFIPGAS